MDTLHPVLLQDGQEQPPPDRPPGVRDVGGQAPRAARRGEREPYLAVPQERPQRLPETGERLVGRFLRHRLIPLRLGTQVEQGGDGEFGRRGPRGPAPQDVPRRAPGDRSPGRPAPASAPEGTWG